MYRFPVLRVDEGELDQRCEAAAKQLEHDAQNGWKRDRDLNEMLV